MRDYQALLNPSTAAMTRSLSQLEQEVRDAGLPMPVGKYGKDELVDLLKQHHWEAENPGQEMPEYVDPMLLRNTKDLPKEKVQEIFESPDWYVEQKRDGVRCIVDYDSSGKPRAYSRNVSTKTYRPGDMTAALFWMPEDPALANTILDGEVISTKSDVDTSPYTKGGKGGTTANVLQAAVALTGIENTREAQEGNGMPLRYVIYDIVKFNGKDLQKLPYTKRREAMAQVAEMAAGSNMIILNPTTNVDKQKVHEDVISKGGEGTVLKHKNAPYQQGKRSPHGLKHKAKDELDCLVTGYLPPKSGTYVEEGLVGGLEFSAKDINSGEWHVVGASSAMTLEDRRAISVQGADGKFSGVKDGVIGTWIYEVEFRGWSRTYRMVHARPLRRRDGEGADSKSPEDCTFDFEAVKKRVDSMVDTASTHGLRLKRLSLIDQESPKSYLKPGDTLSDPQDESQQGQVTEVTPEGGVSLEFKDKKIEFDPEALMGLERTSNVKLAQTPEEEDRLRQLGWSDNEIERMSARQVELILSKGTRKKIASTELDKDLVSKALEKVVADSFTTEDIPDFSLDVNVEYNDDWDGKYYALTFTVDGKSPSDVPGLDYHSLVESAVGELNKTGGNWVVDYDDSAAGHASIKMGEGTTKVAADKTTEEQFDEEWQRAVDHVAMSVDAVEEGKSAFTVEVELVDMFGLSDEQVEKAMAEGGMPGYEPYEEASEPTAPAPASWSPEELEDLFANPDKYELNSYGVWSPVSNSDGDLLMEETGELITRDGMQGHPSDFKIRKKASIDDVSWARDALAMGENPREVEFGLQEAGASPEEIEQIIHEILTDLQSEDFKESLAAKPVGMPRAPAGMETDPETGAVGLSDKSKGIDEDIDDPMDAKGMTGTVGRKMATGFSVTFPNAETIDYSKRPYFVHNWFKDIRREALKQGGVVSSRPKDRVVEAIFASESSVKKFASTLSTQYYVSPKKIHVEKQQTKTAAAFSKGDKVQFMGEMDVGIMPWEGEVVETYDTSALVKALPGEDVPEGHQEVLRYEQLEKIPSGKEARMKMKLDDIPEGSVVAVMGRKVVLRRKEGWSGRVLVQEGKQAPVWVPTDSLELPDAAKTAGVERDWLDGFGCPEDFSPSDNKGTGLPVD